MIRIVHYITLIVLIPIILHAYPEGWSDDILLTPEDSRIRSNPDVDVDAFNNVWVTWDSVTWTVGEILFSKRDSMGSAMIPESNISNNVSRSVCGKVAVDDTNHVHVVWRDASPQGDGLWHSALRNDGSVYVPSHLVVSGAGGFSSTLFPEVAMNRFYEINTIWDERPSGYNQMNYTKLDTDGNCLIEKIRVSNESVNALWPGLGVDSMGNNHFGFRTDTVGATDRLTYTKLDRNGNVVIPNSVLGAGFLPSLIADQTQNIHILYGATTGSGNSIMYLKLDQTGNIIIPPRIISVYESNNWPHMAMDSLQYLHAVWEAESGGTWPIMYAKLDTQGNFVIPPMQVVYPPHTLGGGMARIAVDRNNRLHLVWVDQRMNPGVSTDIFYKRGENETGIRERIAPVAEQNVRISVSPNPFVGMTRISFKIFQNTGSIKFEIFDITGRMVRDFTPPEPEAITYWDGTDNLGNAVPAGVYFIRLSSQNAKQVTPMVLLK
jgi:hypothetical protein